MKLKLTPGLVTDSWELKLTALGLAILLWAAVQSEDLRRFTMNGVPVELRMTEQGWVPVGDAEPASVSVDFRGPVGELIRLAFAEAKLVVPIDDVEDTLQIYRARPEWLEYEGRFDALRVDAVRPPSLTLRFQPIETRTVPIAIRLDTPLKPSVRLDGPPRVEPAQVTIEGPRDRVQALDSLVVRVADVESALQSGGLRLPIDTTGTGVTVAPGDVLLHLRTVPDTVRSRVSGGAGRP